MDETPTDDRPTIPAVPLDYFEPTQATWRPAVRAVAWLVVSRATVGLTSYAFESACFAWQETAAVSRLRSPVILGWPLCIDVPYVAVGVVALAAAVAMLRSREAGRRWAVRALVAECVIGPVTTVVVAAYCDDHYSYLPRSPAYKAYTAGLYGFGAAYSVLFPAVVALLLRRPEARAVFADADDGG